MSRIKSTTPIAMGQRSLRSLDARSFGTTDFGRIDVLYHTPVVPGDDITISCGGLLKGATMPAATMAKMYYDVRFHFVPLRVLTHKPEETGSNFCWDLFIQKLSSVSHPYTTYGAVNDSIAEIGRLYSAAHAADCRRLISQLRLPAGLVNIPFAGTLSTTVLNEKINLWAMMAYQRIWWDRYRDVRFIPDNLLSTYIPYPAPGNNTMSVIKNYLTPRYAMWPKDYFTNALLRSGNEAVLQFNNNIQPSQTSNILENQRPAPDNIPYRADEGTPWPMPDDRMVTLGTAVVNNVQGSTVFKSNLNYQAVRFAKLLDAYFQRMNIAGSSIVNRFLARFGRQPKDEKLNMSQYIGGFRSEFKVGDILSNIETGSLDSPTNAFNIGADGSQVGQSSGQVYHKFSSEKLQFHSESDYGVLMVTGTLIPYTGYFQGLHRSFKHGCNVDIEQARFEYLTPEMVNQGLQPIAKKEVVQDFPTTGSTYEGNNFFAFGERYGEYAFQQDSIDGDLVLSETLQGMDALHLFRVFTAVPQLTESFTTIDPAARESLDRIFNYLRTGEGDSSLLLDHFQRFIEFDCKVHRNLASSMLPDLFEDNNHNNTVDVSVNGNHF